jgi:hypothetical protein
MVDTTTYGTTTISYWAQVPGAVWLHTTRAVVIEGANANAATASTTPEAANDNPPPADVQATGTDASSTAQ